MDEPVEIPFRNLDDLPGATLADRFVLREMVGRGGYGAVFVGEQKSVGRRCAVKVLVPHVLEKQSNVRRFEREARATSQLAHPNTIVIYDFGLDEKRQLLYLVMEYIDGESLRERIRADSQMQLEDAVRIVYQAAGSLQDAHERGLVHRDVKPHNIMITSRAGDPNFVKVIDFGIAKFLDDASIRETFQRVTQTGMIIGTPAYMPPEQVRSQELDGRADQYSLAACAYQMLTGRTMFTGESPVDVATKQLTHKPQPPSEHNPSIPGAVDAVILKGLAKEAVDRYPTIMDFAIALADAAEVSIGALDSNERNREQDALERTASDVVHATLPMESVVVDATTQPMGLETNSAELLPEPQPLEPISAPTIDDATAEPGIRPSPRIMAQVEQPAPTDSRGGYAIGATLLFIVVVAALIFAGAGEREVEPIVANAERPVSNAEKVEPAVLFVAPEPTAPEPDVGREVARVVDAGADTRDEAAVEVAAVPRPEPKPKKPAVTGRIEIVVVPWGDVVIDGQNVGDSRRQRHELTPGKHVFELYQSGERVGRKTVDVKPGKNTMVKLIASP